MGINYISTLHAVVIKMINRKYGRKNAQTTEYYTLFPILPSDKYIIILWFTILT